MWTIAARCVVGIGVTLFAIMEGTNRIAEFGESFPKVLTWIARPDTLPKPQIFEVKSPQTPDHKTEMASVSTEPSQPFLPQVIAPESSVPPPQSRPVVTPPSETAPPTAPRKKEGKQEQKKPVVAERATAAEELKAEVEGGQDRAKVSGWAQVAAIPGLATTGKDTLIISIKSELRRLNCYSGEPNADWGKDIKSAVQRFNIYGYTKISVEPEKDTISTLQGYQAAVCP